VAPEVRYSRGSMVENTMYRYKCIIGPAMQSRTLQGQRVESRLGCRILNRMAAPGMPKSTRWTDLERGAGGRIAEM
jgi:hypothetical protein